MADFFESNGFGEDGSLLCSTGLRPVQFGVSPNWGCGARVLSGRDNIFRFRTPNGFRRDAGNNGRDARATHDYFAQRLLRGRGHRLPLAVAVEHLAHKLSYMPRAFRIRVKIAGHHRMFQRFLDAQKNRFYCKQPLLHMAPPGERIFPRAFAPPPSSSTARSNPPRAAPREMTRTRIQQSQFIRCDQHESRFIQSTPPRAPEHLQDFIRPNRFLHRIAAIRFPRECHAAQRKINSRREPHRRHHHAQLSRLRQRLDHSRAHRVAQTAVMIRHARLEQPRKVFAHNSFFAPHSGSGLGVGNTRQRFRRQRFCSACPAGAKPTPA